MLRLTIQGRAVRRASGVGVVGQARQAGCQLADRAVHRHRLERTGGEFLLPQLIPDMFQRIEFRSAAGPPGQADVLREVQVELEDVLNPSLDIPSCGSLLAVPFPAEIFDRYC